MSPMPLVGPGQSPGRGFNGAKPPTENNFQCFRMAWKAFPCTILLKKKHRFSIGRNIKRIYDRMLHMNYLHSGFTTALNTAIATCRWLIFPIWKQEKSNLESSEQQMRKLICPLMFCNSHNATHFLRINIFAMAIGITRFSQK